MSNLRKDRDFQGQHFDFIQMHIRYVFIFSTSFAINYSPIPTADLPYVMEQP